MTNWDWLAIGGAFSAGIVVGFWIGAALVAAFATGRLDDKQHGRLEEQQPVPLSLSISQVVDRDDPYGSTVRAIHDLTREALDEADAMSADEQGKLVAIDEFIRRRDNV